MKYSLYEGLHNNTLKHGDVNGDTVILTYELVGGAGRGSSFDQAT